MLSAKKILLYNRKVQRSVELPVSFFAPSLYGGNPFRFLVPLTETGRGESQGRSSLPLSCNYVENISNLLKTLLIFAFYSIIFNYVLL